MLGHIIATGTNGRRWHCGELRIDMDASVLQCIWKCVETMHLVKGWDVGVAKYGEGKRADYVVDPAGGPPRARYLRTSKHPGPATPPRRAIPSNDPRQSQRERSKGLTGDASAGSPRAAVREVPACSNALR